MRPGTLHAVLTVETGMTIGEHYYLGPSLDETISAIFHGRVHEPVLSNTNHDGVDVRTMARVLFLIFVDDIMDERMWNVLSISYWM